MSECPDCNKPYNPGMGHVFLEDAETCATIAKLEKERDDLKTEVDEANAAWREVALHELTIKGLRDALEPFLNAPLSETKMPRRGEDEEMGGSSSIGWFGKNTAEKHIANLRIAAYVPMDDSADRPYRCGAFASGRLFNGRPDQCVLESDHGGEHVLASAAALAQGDAPQSRAKLTANDWRNDALEAAAGIAERYGASDAAIDIRAMIRVSDAPQKEEPR